MTTESFSLLDAVAWFLNVSSSVLIVFVNKQLMDRRSGYGFVFATTLCALHFLTCACSVWVMEILGLSQRAKLPIRDAIFFSSVASISIASLNISLLINTVGFYQIAKLLVIPFICGVEFIWLGRRFSIPVILSVLTVMVGVGIVTVTDTLVTMPGLLIAALSVVASGSQQILCGTFQRKFKLSSHQLLSNTAPLQGFMLLLIGPFLDEYISGGRWVLDYSMQQMALVFLVSSCGIAVLVNISQFMCLGRFSAVSFQVIGHTKTISVLLVGWLYFHENMTFRKALGMSLAVLGMVLYGFFSSQQKPAAPAPKAAETVPLLTPEEKLQLEQAEDEKVHGHVKIAK